MTPRVSLAALMLALLVPAGAGAVGPYPPQIEASRVETYKTVGDTALRLWIIAPETEPQDRRPAIVFFFGGGWRTGSPQQFEHQCRQLAERGMVAITADYRVASRHLPRTSRPGRWAAGPHSPWPSR